MTRRLAGFLGLRLLGRSVLWVWLMSLIACPCPQCLQQTTQGKVMQDDGNSQQVATHTKHGKVMIENT